MKRLLLITIALITLVTVQAQERKHAFELNQRLGRGVNMGNSFEANTEAGWGNPWKPEYFKLMAEQGFDHVRLPVNWSTDNRTQATAPFTIEPAFLQRIETVVDEALKNGLHIIINMHHHQELFDNPTANKARFLAQWKQIAEHFQSYSDSLVFELLNEPNTNLTAELWNDFLADALKVVRQSNPDRVVLIGSAEWGGIGGIDKLILPDDEHLIFTVHYYNPFNFTHQGADWSEGMVDVTDVLWQDTEAERQSIHQDFARVKRFGEENNVPIHVGEFGAYNKADLDSRVRWTTYLARWMEEQGFSWAYWEFSAGFGIYEPDKGTFIQPLVDALMKNPIPEPAQTVERIVYEVDFNNGIDGWNVVSQAGAVASYKLSGDKMQVDVGTSGTAAWHIQLMKQGIPLEKGKNYRIQFNASSTQPASVTQYIGQNGGDWGAYSSYNSVALTGEEQEYDYSFSMAKSDDPAARIVFDLGSLPKDASLFLNRFSLKEITILPSSLEPLSRPEQLTVVFNADQNELLIDNKPNYRIAQIYSLSGTLQQQQRLISGLNRLDISRLQSGTCLIRMEGAAGGQTLKLLITD